jgi:hypothetical protein
MARSRSATFISPPPLFLVPASSNLPAKRTRSFPLLDLSPSLDSQPPSYPWMPSDSDDDGPDDEIIYTARPFGQLSASSSSSLRTRIFGSVLNGTASSSSSKSIPKTICTTSARLCAGETETETDEPVSGKSRCLSLSQPEIDSSR